MESVDVNEAEKRNNNVFGKGDNSALSFEIDDFNADVGMGRDDDAIVDGDNKQELVEKRYRVRNLSTAMSLMGVVMIAEMIYTDAYSQWLYFRFTKQVLGANYSQLNVSAIKHPCLQTNSSSENKYSKQLNEAQELTSDFQSWTYLITVLPAVFSNILFGFYLDYLGRKLFFIIPITGLLIKFVTAWVVCLWNLNVYVLFFSYFVQGATGSFAALFMAIYVYTADNTDEHKSRSVEMVLVDCVIFSISSLSHMAVGYSIAYIGYMWPLAAASLLCFAGLLGYIFLLRETLPRRRDLPRFSIIEGVKSVFSFYIKKSPNSEHQRKDFIILITVFLLFALTIGPTIMFLFLLNEPFCWNSKKIGDVKTIVGILKSICSIISLKLMKMIVSDEMVVVIILLFSVAYQFTFSLAQADWAIYIGFGLSLMQGAPLSLVRAILSRMIPITKRGSLFASIAVTEVAIISISGVSFNALYAHTVHIWKGLTYFVISLVVLLSTLTMAGFIVIKKRRKFVKMPNAEINICDDNGSSLHRD